MVTSTGDLLSRGARTLQRSALGGTMSFEGCCSATVEKWQNFAMPHDLNLTWFESLSSKRFPKKHTV